MRWKRDGQKKVVLKASEKQLRDYLDDDNQLFSIVDEGLTQIPSGSLTVIATIPSTKYNETFKDLKLL